MYHEGVYSIIASIHCQESKEESPMVYHEESPGRGIEEDYSSELGDTLQEIREAKEGTEFCKYATPLLELPPPLQTHF